MRKEYNGAVISGTTYSNGTHVIIIMNYKGYAFSQKARKIMKQENKPNGTMFKHSNVDELFNLVKTKDGIIITVGKFKVSSKRFKTYKQADEYLATKPYEILINVAVLMCKLNNNEEEENKAVHQESAKDA